MLSFTTRRQRSPIYRSVKGASVHPQGFSLFEMAIVLVIIAILLTAVGIPLATQVQARRTEETRRMLDEAKDALLGFAMANGRFPCPAFANATTNSGGRESFCTAATGSCAGSETNTPQSHGNCSNFTSGFLPASTLGMSPLDDQGFLQDSWATRSNRIRYIVFDGTIVSAHPFTSWSAMQAATLSNLGNPAQNYLYICSSGTGVTATNCGSTANELTTHAPILIMSLGPNAATGSGGTDEAMNIDNDNVFVSHTPVVGGTNAFDDILTWIPINIIMKKMLDAGKLP